MAGNAIHQPHDNQMEQHARDVPTRGPGSEEVVIQPEPQILERPVVRALRVRAIRAEVPEIMRERFPEERRLRDLVVRDDHLAVVVHEPIAERAEISHQSREQREGRRQDLVAPSADSVRERVRAALVESSAYVAMLLVYLGVRFEVLGFITRSAPRNTASFGEALLSIPLAIANYLAIVAAPWLAGPAHQFDFVSSALSPGFYLASIGLLALGYAAYLALRNTKHRKIYLFVAIWMFLGLLPVLDLRSLVPDALIEDRYLYLPSAAAFIFIAELGSDLATNYQWRSVGFAVGGIAAVFYGVLLWNVEGYWHDEVSLFSGCIERNPSSPLCHARLASALEQRGDLDGSEREFRRAIDLEPENFAALYDLGHLHVREGRAREGEVEVSRALAGLPNMPASLYLDLAQIADAANDQPGVEQALSEAIKRDPSMADPADLLRAEMAANNGDLSGAERILEALLNRSPRYAKGWSALGALHDTDGRPEQALNEVSQALQIAPNDASIWLLHARLLHELGHEREAISECRLVIRAQPKNQEAQNLYAKISRDLTRDQPPPPPLR